MRRGEERNTINEPAEMSKIIIEIRQARPEDSTALGRVHLVAFGGPVEAKLVQLISERKKALITLVAVSEGPSGWSYPLLPSDHRQLTGYLQCGWIGSCCRTA